MLLVASIQSQAPRRCVKFATVNIFCSACMCVTLTSSHPRPSAALSHLPSQTMSWKNAPQVAQLQAQLTSVANAGPAFLDQVQSLAAEDSTNLVTFMDALRYIDESGILKPTNTVSSSTLLVIVFAHHIIAMKLAPHRGWHCLQPRAKAQD